MEEKLYEALHESQQVHWWYVARRTIFDALLSGLSAAQELPEGRIYDLGCGVGANLKMLRRHGEVVGVDGSQSAVDFCHSRGLSEVRQLDLSRLCDLPKGDARTVLLTDVLEHLEDERSCLDGIYRLLAPGGVALLTVPAFAWLWGPSDVASHHLRRYTKTQLLERVGANFEVSYCTYFNCLLFPLVSVGRIVEAMSSKQDGTRYASVPRAPLNAALTATFSLESKWLAQERYFPFGSSLLLILRRPKSSTTAAPGFGA